MRKIVWFSCGAASAIAAKLAVKKYKDAIICYCATMPSEHPDNDRFLKDVSKWIDRDIVILSNDKYHTIDDVFEHQKFLKNSYGAPCTRLLKKKPRQNFANPDDLNLFGFTLEETERAALFDSGNFELKTEHILIDNGISHSDCLGLLWSAGIKIPVMYDLGYGHNNCLGCVKGGMGYWNKIRVDFPEVFARRSKQERKFGYSLCKDYFLDELPKNAGNFKKEPSISCGVVCQVISKSI